MKTRLSGGIAVAVALCTTALLSAGPAPTPVGDDWYADTRRTTLP